MASQWLDFTNDKTSHHKTAKLQRQKRRGKLGVYLGYVQLLAEKTNLETQEARGVCLGMSKTF